MRGQCIVLSCLAFRKSDGDHIAYNSELSIKINTSYNNLSHTSLFIFLVHHVLNCLSDCLCLRGEIKNILLLQILHHKKQRKSNSQKYKINFAENIKMHVSALFIIYIHTYTHTYLLIDKYQMALGLNRLCYTISGTTKAFQKVKVIIRLKAQNSHK